MRKIDVKNTFKKDYRQILKQGWSENAIDKAIKQLANDDILNPQLKLHPLSGNYKGYMECHIFSDLVIIYKRDTEILSLYRIGRHQDLFKRY